MPVFPTTPYDPMMQFGSLPLIKDYRRFVRDVQFAFHFDLRTLLQSSITGNLVLAFYEASNTLDSTMRQRMINLIIEYFYEAGYFIGNKEYQIIAAKISELFPTEIEQNYYFHADKSLNRQAGGRIKSAHLKFLGKIRKVHIDFGLATARPKKDK